MRITILTIGTRGDVQPYIALGIGLQAAGHTVRIATPGEFKSLVSSYGLQHDTLRGDFLNAAQNTGPAAGGNSNPLKTIRQYVEMARDTLVDEWVTAQDAEVFIYNPAAIGGYHIAERLGVPSFSAFPAPLYSPTRAFPSPFMPFSNLGPFNKLSHHLFARMGPLLYRRAIREFRKDVLGLPPARGESMLAGKPVVRLYAYSESVLPRPTDWSDNSVVTGYWFLDAPASWRPDPVLVQFLQDGPPPVYIGFGSMSMMTGERKMDMALDALRLTGQRGVIAGTLGDAARQLKDIYQLDAAPHDWLFPNMAVIVHHGGAGTTGASLRAGKPTIVCPFVGDQHFWGRRVAAIGAGPMPISQSRLSTERLSQAIQAALIDSQMQRRAASIGEILRTENGVERAVAYLTARV